MSDKSTADLPCVRATTLRHDGNYDISTKANWVYKVAPDWHGDLTLYWDPFEGEAPPIAQVRELDKCGRHFTCGEKTVFTLVTQDGKEKSLGPNSCFFTDAQHTVWVKKYDSEVPASASSNSNAASLESLCEMSNTPWFSLALVEAMHS